MIKTSASHIKHVVFGTALFPPVQYFAHMLRHQEVLVEGHCHYMRQTYRNRYLLMGANGLLTMTVPVGKVSGEKTMTKDVEVSYHTNWQDLHWKSIVSAYNASPYFQYYDVYLEPLFNRKWKYLLDLNNRSLHTIFECLDLNPGWSNTSEYLTTELYEEDYRELIHPKRSLQEDESFIAIPYRQVYAQKHGFIPNLSILDLLFNKGPESLIVLKDSVQKMASQRDA